MRAYEFLTNTPVKLDEHRGYLVDDVALVRSSPPLSEPTSEGMIERCVVVQRQSDGYGFTVTGDHPVFVHTVKPDGAAFCAGVREGDRILKVNGMPVTSSNHLDVVRMISGGQNVVLTLLGAPPEPLGLYLIPDSKLDTSSIHEPVLIEQNTGKEDWKRKRKELLSQMLDEERKHVEGLRDSENSEKLDRALKRIVSLQSQLRHVKPWIIINTCCFIFQSRTPMDGDSDEDETESLHGPFSNLAELKTHPAHLAVFINYLLSNANPNSLFFYVITDAFQNAQGAPKDFRRWAFEIFTTFVIPNSPLVIPNSDQSIIQPIDKILATTSEQICESDVEILKRVFVPGRQRAVTDINEHMANFRQKRQLGLGTIFDANQLANLARGDTAMENRVGEQMMFRALENIVGSSNDFDSCDMKTQAIVASLATVIRVVLGPKPSTTSWEKIMERYPQFIMKDKGGKSRKPPSSLKAKAQVKGHMFVVNPVNTVHYCYQCRDAIWGMQPWCYFCANCDVKVHTQCTSSLTDACYPATQGKHKSKTRRAGLMGKSDAEDEETPRVEHNVKSTSSDSGIGQEIHDKPVGRSHSMRNRVSTIPQIPDERLTTKRDRSTPSWGSDLPPADEEEESTRRLRTVESRSEASDYLSNVLFLKFTRLKATKYSVQMKRAVERMQASSIYEDDSDLEVETEAPPLDQLVGWDVIRHLKPKEKKRQEVINELFHTERTHVRNLKILLRVFYKPMLMNNVVSPDVVHLLFANLDQLLEIHTDMSNRMRQAVEQWRRDPNLNGLYGNIGELMEKMFEGEAGEKFMQVTSTFCQHQQHALEMLRTRCKKDKEDALVRFLADAEANALCRKLQLKDMIPVEMQRLVKYPLLLETIAKYTNEPSEEQDRLLRTVVSAKRILSAVNTAKRNAENLRRLEELQRRMDTTPFDKEFSGHDYAYLNLTKYRLVHDGPLTCRFNRGKMIELHVVLLENMLVFLTKHSDGNKLQLKTLEPSKETKWSPIMPLAPLIAKEKANDKRAFFLVFNSQYGAQIYELVAATATERKTWFKLISDQIENDKKHQTQGIELEAFPVVPTFTSLISMSLKVHVLTHPRLVHASEITVQQPTVLEHAQPVLTPTERLRRSDDVIFQALLTKQTILAQFLPGEKKGRTEELEKLTELLGGLAVADLKQRDCKELAMSAIVHGNRLLDSINQGMNARKEADETNPGASLLVLDDAEKNLPSVPCYKLTAIAAPLMNHLKALMQVIQDQQSELNTVKQQLYHYKELAESGSRDRSVSEETLTECATDPQERKLITKRQRTPSIQPVT
ncbi:unnamed protein product [Haemonchus placei]|uniref:PDZ domain-containing protein n=1 Tax=Haemonchus placei TaxID=6290 RepID=A0A0N4W0N9_HAEPC|nr:unnamed protein product [Haemonchus placei]